MLHDPSSPRRADGPNIGIAAGDLRPLAAFLDMALPLDSGCAILDLTPAPGESPGDLLAALDRAIDAEVKAGWLIPDGVDKDGTPTFNIRRAG